MEPHGHRKLQVGDRIRYQVKGEHDEHTGTLQSIERGQDGSILGYEMLEDHPENPVLMHSTSWHVVSLEFIEAIGPIEPIEAIEPFGP